MESVEDEVALARAKAAQAALDAQGTEAVTDRNTEAKRFLEREYQARLESCARPGGPAPDPIGLGALRRRTLAAERVRLEALRREKRIGDDAFHQVEEELDWAQAEKDEAGR